MKNDNGIDIRVVANYFGKPLPYLQLWLDSCGFNKEIIWFFVTDIEMGDYEVPDNVKVVKSSFESMRSRFEKHFPYAVRYEKPWDFCAFKPTLGAVFTDEIACADYWGWSDCDVIFGDLKPVVNSCYNSAVKVMPKGHFSLLKNDYELNRFILRHPLTQKALSLGGSGLPCFDEEAFPKLILAEFGGRQVDDFPFVNTACRYGNFILDDTEALFNRLHVEPRRRREFPFVITWNRGHMIAHFVMESGRVEKVEIAYSHFFRRDMTSNVERLLFGGCYLIAPNFIERYDGHDFTADEIRVLDRFRIHWTYYKKRLSFNFICQKAMSLLKSIY